MNPVAISGPLASASSAASILSSASRIVQSNNWRDVEIYAIEKATEVSRNRINHNAKADKYAIDSCYTLALDALGSSKLTSEQKRKIFILMANKFSQI